MTLTVIKENRISDKQTYYTLNRPIKLGRGMCRIFRIKNAIKSECFLPEWEIITDLNKGIDTICMSDANTHIERLIFPCVLLRNKETGEIRHAHTTHNIEGDHTFMSHGGDASSVFPIEEYLTRLGKINRKEARELLGIKEGE